MGPSWAHFWKVFGPQSIRNQSPRSPWAVQEPILTMFLGSRRSPRALQERSKRPPRDLQATKTAPRALQEAPRSMLEPFGSHFGVDFQVVLEPSSVQKAEQRAESRATRKPPCGSKRSPEVPQIGGTGRKPSTMTKYPHQGPAEDGREPLG